MDGLFQAGNHWAYLIELLIRSSVLLSAAWLACYLFTKRNPLLRLYLLRATFAGTVALPLLMQWTPQFSVPVQSGFIAAPVERLAGMGTQAPPVFETTTQIPQPDTAAAIGGIQQNEPVSPKPDAQHVPLWVWVVGIWSAVAALLLCRILYQNRRIKQIITRTEPVPDFVRDLFAGMDGETSRVQLRASGHAPVPFVYGLRRPVIVLPAPLLRQSYRNDLRAVLAHELSHVESRDLAWMTGFRLLASLFWFHPLAWLVRSAHEETCEEVSDRRAAVRVGGAQPYSKTLARVTLELLAQKPTYTGLAMASLPQIRRRLEGLKSYGEFMPLSRGRITALGIGCAVLLFMIAGFNGVRAQDAAGLDQNMTVEELVTRLEQARTNVPDIYFEKTTHARNKTIIPDEPEPEWRYYVAFQEHWSDQKRYHYIDKSLPDELYSKSIEELSAYLRDNKPERLSHDLFIDNTRVYVYGSPKMSSGGAAQISKPEPDETGVPFSWNFGSDLVPLGEILRENLPKLSITHDAHNGTACYLLEGDTTWGDYKIWIDPSHNFFPVKLEVTRDRKDKHWDGRIMGETKVFGEGFPSDPGRTASYSLQEVVSFQTVDGYTIWQEVRFVSSETNVRGDKSTGEGITEYRNVNVNPDFEAAGAFSTESLVPAGIELNLAQASHFYWDEKGTVNQY